LIAKIPIEMSRQGLTRREVGESQFIAFQRFIRITKV
jgi:hypothetical protein